MNKPLRRVTIACLVLFGLLLVNINYLQAFDADSLKTKPGNSRVLIEQYQHQRGPIVVGGKPVAYSVPTNDTYKYLRKYTDGPMYAPVTGYYSVFQAKGVEKAENDMLDGTSGQLFVRRMMDLFTGKKPKGASVVLTVNRKAQEAAYNGLKQQGHKGAVVALEPKTGKILAMATLPSYDPNKLASHDGQKVNQTERALAAAKSQPLLNRATSQTYPPGSTFKVITSAAALGTGHYDANSTISAPHTYTPPQTTMAIHNDSNETCGSGDQDSLKDALAMSCNTAFAKLGVKLGQQKLHSQAQRFGFGDSNIDVPMQVAPSEFPTGLDKPQTAQSAIGQYNVRLTPIQDAMVASAVANGGSLMKPYLVDRVTGPGFSTIEKTSPSQYSQPMDSSTADNLKQMMEAVTTSSDGTGRNVKIPGTKVAAKTGTAQTVPGVAPDTWFISFAPADNPKVAVAVVVEHGGKAGSDAYGATVAGPIAKSVMEAVIGR